mmetsp:Transcript_20251/g.57559  ORF Transcript_20251/g.57559 Transcript_20251/m.57559 type:complete len:1130 (+) Transcript_20251:100-3489(+)
MHAHGRCAALGGDAWVVGLSLGAGHPARSCRPPTRLHFVLDNSGSMGSNSQHAQECFADLVDLAGGPCSVVAFDSSAHLLGDHFRTAQEVRAARLPRQGGTNITAGVERALEVVRSCEEGRRGGERPHHILILLSDGAHMVGPRPQERLPVLGSQLRAALPALRLSVVVVGVTRSSDTSMGMLLKSSLETVMLPDLEPIYFAASPSEMRGVLGQMHAGMASLRGSVVSVVAPEGRSFVRAVGEAGSKSVDLLADAGEQGLLCLGASPPEEVEVDGVRVACAAPPADAAGFDAGLAASALQSLVHAVRVRRVAVGADGVRTALRQLGSWVAALEERAAASCSGARLSLAKATPAERLSQHRALRGAVQGARELRNQLVEIEAHRADDSASQATFLNGASRRFGAKALLLAARNKERAGGDVDPAARLQELRKDIASIAPRMRLALREDFCAKLGALDDLERVQLHTRLVRTLPEHVPRQAISTLCGGGITVDMLATDLEVAALVDSGVAIESLLAVAGQLRQSFLSLQSAWEQLKDWCDPATDSCGTEYQLLMCFGALGCPIDVSRCDATQMDPYAMSVTRVRAAPADSASLLTALHSDQQVVPPEGGVPLQDLLVLVDPDVPNASRLAANSALLRESYTSVVLCRDLHMYTGNKMRLALHAHSLLAAVQPPPTAASKEDLRAQLRRQYLGRAFQCSMCGFGPIDHFACSDLEAHHGEDVGGGVISNACPRCQWFSPELADWPKWDGSLPPEAVNGADAPQPRATASLTAASVEIALRICYSARALSSPAQDGEAQELLRRLDAWDTLTAADGVEHPVQLLLALAAQDEVPEGALGQVPLLALLNEVCARRARSDGRREAGGDDARAAAAARKRCEAFLGVHPHTAPCTRPLEEGEPRSEAVREACCGEWSLDAEAFDFKAWVREALTPWASALVFVRRLRSSLRARGGGWRQLGLDLERGPAAWADVARELQRPFCAQGELCALLGVRRPGDAPRVLATVAAQAFLHGSSQLRRTAAAGGALREPLGDVRDGDTLRGLCVDLRMAIYEERVAAKMREWSVVGASLVYQRARVADLSQYAGLLGSGHTHGLDKPTFWGLWRAARAGGADAENARLFLSRSNAGFVNKHGR